MIKGVIFDLWETLGTKNVGISKTFFEHFSVPHENRIVKKYERAVQLKAWKTEEDMSRALLLDFNVEPSEANIVWTRDIFRAGIEKSTLFPGILELLKVLKNTYKLALISNTTVFESTCLDNLGIRSLFDVVTFSWEEQILKPAPEIFNITLQKLQLLPEEALYIDDGLKNVEVAKFLGMQAIVFTEFGALKKSLVELGTQFS